MKNSLLKTVVAAGLSLGLLSGTANAAPVFFFGEGGTVASGAAATARANFISALTAGVSTEDFESFSNNDGAPLPLMFAGGLGAINASLTGTATVLDTAGSGRFATSGTNFVESRPGMSVDFGTNQIAAFGFFATDIGDFGGQLSIDLLTAGGTTNTLVNHTVGASGNPNGELLFWGVIDTVDTFTQVTFNNTDTSDAFGFDDLTVGDVSQVIAVPEPGMLALFGLGLAGIGFARRKRAV